MSLVKRFERNTKGRDFVMGDLHGMFAKLADALDRVEFDESADRLFSVGDLVDRGPDSDEAIELLAEPWFHAVRGNHEQMLIDFYAHGHGDGCESPERYVRNGGAWYFDLSEQGKADFFRELSNLPYVIEIDTPAGKIGIVHAECPTPEWDVLIALVEGGNQDVLLPLLWSRNRIHKQDQSVIAGVKMIVCGHVALEKAGHLGNHFFIDTGAYFNDGRLTLALIAGQEGKLA